MRQNIELIIKNNNESIDMSNYCNRLNRAKFAFNPRANRTTAKSNNPRRSTPLCTPLADRTLANATYRTFHCVQYSRGICETRFPRLKLSRENIFTPLSLHSVIVRAISKPYARSTAYYKTLVSDSLCVCATWSEGVRDRTLKSRNWRARVCPKPVHVRVPCTYVDTYG